jgi:hypothetical protein
MRTAVLVAVVLALSGCDKLQPSKPGTILSCSTEMGGPRYTRPCDAQFDASAQNIKVKADVLQKVGVEFGISKDKLIQVSDKTVNSTLWLRDLCADWNACAIGHTRYQDLKTKLMSIEDNYFRIIQRAEEISAQPGKKGPADPAVKEVEILVDSQLLEINRIQAELPRKP